MKTIALFTSFKPDIGGGAKNLRTLTAGFQSLRIQWSYLGLSEASHEGATLVGPPLSGGGAQLPDVWRTLLLWTGGLRARIETICDRLDADRPDAYWVVAHNEGIPVGLELLRRGKAPVHVSVHDDQEFGMYGRSRRYRMLARLTRKPARELLRRAASVDVTSDGMQRYYASLLGIGSLVVHPVMPGRTREAPPVVPGGKLSVGHIGTLYSLTEMAGFCAAVAQVAAERRQPAHVVMIGGTARSRRLDAIPGVTFEHIGNLPEPAAVDRLAQCDFVYSMYPFEASAEVFRTTSFPTKLTTYTDAERPIFAHAPELSTLAEFVRERELGEVCPTIEPSAIAGAIRRILTMRIPAGRFQQVREQVFGIANSTSLEALLLQTAGTGGNLTGSGL